MCDYKKCPYRMEGCYQSDCWMTYNACTLVKDGSRDYATCNPNAEYCKFSKSNNKEELIKQKEETEKINKIRRLEIDIEWNNSKIRQLMEENVELNRKIEELKSK